MKTMIRNLAVAAPLAFAALTMAPVPAFASDPVIVLPPSEPDPAPMDIAIPKPEPVQPDGPDKIAQPKPGPVQPDGPDELAPPKPGPVQPDGPDDIAQPDPDPVVDPGNPAEPTIDPTVDPTLDPTADPTGDPTGDPTDADESGESDQGPVAEQAVLPADYDTDLASTVDSDDDNLALAFLVAGGTLVTVSGAAFAARRRARRTA
jgi:hypothetical protein